MEKKYTPGPWHALSFEEQNMISIGKYQTVEEYNTPGDTMKDGTVAGIWSINNENLANAKLIAAAPDMLQSLREMTNLAAHGVEKAARNSHPSEQAQHESELLAMIDRANEVIKKATA